MDYDHDVGIGERKFAAKYFCRCFPHWQSWTHRIRFWGLVKEKWTPRDDFKPQRWSDEPPRRVGVCPRCGGHTTTTLQVRAGRVLQCVDGVWRPSRAPPYTAFRQLIAGEPVTTWPPDKPRRPLHGATHAHG